MDILRFKSLEGAVVNKAFKQFVTVPSEATIQHVQYSTYIPTTASGN
jgi:hypothetical protein